MNPSIGKPIEILLVEDSPSDADLTMEALASSKVTNHLSHVEDGVEALEFLHKEGVYANAPRPDLILLDLNLPRKDGREVLAEIKSDPQLSSIPVVVLSTSEADRDVAKSYSLHANCYIVKPVDFRQFLHVIHSIESFWLTVVKMPAAAQRP